MWLVQESRANFFHQSDANLNEWRLGCRVCTRLTQFGCFHFVFSLALQGIFLSSDWLLWLLWFCFHDSQSKSAITVISNRTFSALSQSSSLPMYFSGLVDRKSLKEKPNLLYTNFRKSRQPLISSPIWNKKTGTDKSHSTVYSRLQNSLIPTENVFLDTSKKYYFLLVRKIFSTFASATNYFSTWKFPTSNNHVLQAYPQIYVHMEKRSPIRKRQCR